MIPKLFRRLDAEKTASQPKILIVSQPNFPVPSFVRNGAAALVIEDTVEALPSTALVSCFSLWDPELKKRQYRHDKYYHLRRDDLWFRAYRRAIGNCSCWEAVSDQFSPKYRDFLLGLTVRVRSLKPDIVVVHTTKMDWLLAVQSAVSANCTVVAYHHNSEDHLVSKSTFCQLVHNIDAHIFVSHYSEKLFHQKAVALGIASNLHTYVVHNGIDIDSFSSSTADRSQLRQMNKVDAEQQRAPN